MLLLIATCGLLMTSDYLCLSESPSYKLEQQRKRSKGQSGQASISLEWMDRRSTILSFTARSTWCSTDMEWMNEEMHSGWIKCLFWSGFQRLLELSEQVRGLMTVSSFSHRLDKVVLAQSRMLLMRMWMKNLSLAQIALNRRRFRLILPLANIPQPKNSLA